MTSRKSDAPIDWYGWLHTKTGRRSEEGGRNPSRSHRIVERKGLIDSPDDEDVPAEEIVHRGELIAQNKKRFVGGVNDWVVGDPVAIEFVDWACAQRLHNKDEEREPEEPLGAEERRARSVIGVGERRFRHFRSITGNRFDLRKLSLFGIGSLE